jgi:hypothetical protein
MGILLANYNDPYNQLLTLELLKRGLPITAVVSNELSFFADKKLPKKVQLFDVYDFYFKEKVLQLNKHNQATLSKTDVEEYYHLESLFLKVTDRLSFWPLPVRVRLDLYYELLLFWLTFFRQNKIELVVFAQTPHTGSDNVIYHVAQQRGIPVVVGTPTLVNDHILLRHDYDYSQKVPTSFQKQASKASLVKKIKPELYQSIFGSSTWLDIGKQINTRVLKNNQRNVGFRVIENLVKQFFANPQQSWQHLFERTRSSGFVFTGNFKVWQEFLLSVLYYFPKKQLAAYYEQLATPVDLKKKFVIFALHYQPERTTMPEGGVFEHQLLAIKMLARSLPKGWLIYVKEHPRQFSLNDVRTNNFRDRNYYDRLAEIPQVRLLPVAQNTAELIPKAQFTASVQGSIGWEGLLQGKPALIFANAWYAPCRSAYQVSSLAECSKVVAEIRSKNKIAVELDLLRFLAYTQHQFILSAFYHESASKSSRDYTMLLMNLATALTTYYAKNIKKK